MFEQMLNFFVSTTLSKLDDNKRKLMLGIIIGFDWAKPNTISINSKQFENVKEFYIMLLLNESSVLLSMGFSFTHSINSVQEEELT